jgi:NAD(P)-dependent dehydrogenase (short-subunit alcohol dehydrogenase family)
MNLRIKQNFWWILSLSVLVVALLIDRKYRRQCRQKLSTHQTWRIADGTAPFAGKVVFISGGTSGIGLSTAIAFAHAGASHIIVCGRQPSKWQSIALPKIKQALAPTMQSIIEYVQADVRVYDEIRQVIQSIVKKYGKLDVAFNNAGIAAGALISQQTLTSTVHTGNGLSFDLSGPQPWSASTAKCTDPSLQTPTSPFCENAIFTDGIGVWNCMKAEIEVMVKQLPSKDPPCIVNTASVNSIWGSPGGVFYGAAKAMVHLLTKGVAVEQASIPSSPIFPNLPLRVNCIMPGAVYTPLLADQIAANATYDQANAAAKAGVPMGRIAYPEEIAPTVLFLADNSKSSYITGASILIDGGLTAAPLL